MLRIKVCGITDYEDARLSVGLGADALGFIFAASPRKITLEKARSIIDILPPFVQTVGVFVNESPDTIRRVMKFCGLDLVQLHGHEPPDACRELMPHSIKAFRLKDESSLLDIPAYAGKVRAILFDTYSERKMGGTGKTFDWRLALKGRGEGLPVILSGGLTPSNIAEAVSTVRPYAVDVNSGVEERPGKKDPVLLKNFMKAIGRAGVE